jgi:hypothetical protein
VRHDRGKERRVRRRKKKEKRKRRKKKYYRWGEGNAIKG